MKEVVKEFMNGTYEYNGKLYNNVINAGGEVIFQDRRKKEKCKGNPYGVGTYFFYCDSVNQEQLEKYCEEHNLGYEITVVKNMRVDKDRVFVDMWKKTPEKLMDAYREVFPTPNDLVEHLKYDGTDDGEFLTVATDYTCFIDIYEKYGDDDFDDDDDYQILLLMKRDLQQLNYKVKIDNYNTLSAILND